MAQTGYLCPGLDVVGLNGNYHVEKALSSKDPPRVWVGHKSDAADPAGAPSCTTRGERLIFIEVSASDADAWTKIDALVREGQILKSLNHPSIPAFVDLFVFDGARASAPEALSRTAKEDSAQLPSIVLVRRFVEGVSLSRAIRERRRFQVADVERLFRGLLEARRYADSLLPAVLHGDISPSHVLIRPNGEPSLVGFGRVAEPMGGKAADLAAIATTVLSAATHQAPAQMPCSPETGLIDVRAIAPLLSPRTERALLACLKAPRAEKPADAASVLRSWTSRLPDLERVKALWPARLRGRKTRRIVAGAVLAAAGATGLSLGLLQSAPQDPAEVWADVPVERAEVQEVSPVTANPEPEPAPSAAPSTEPDPPSAEGELHCPGPATESEGTALRWTGQVLSATGGLRAGDACILDLRASVLDNTPLCTVSLSCGDRLLVNRAEGGDCRLNEIEVAEGAYAYETALWIENGNGEQLAISRAGVVHGTKRDAQGKVEETWHVKLTPRSFPRNGEPIFAREGAHLPERRTGVVTRTEGPAPAAVAQMCSLRITPPEGAYLTSQILDNLQRLRVSCAGSTLYDGEERVLINRDGTRYFDTVPSLLDGTPRMEEYDGELYISDTTPQGPWSVSIHLGPHQDAL